MTQRKLDFLSRRPVQATIPISLDISESLVASRLPEGYLLENGIFRFPAGYWESYFVDGKEYNVEGNRTIEEQRDLIANDLAKEGFTREEIDEFIAGIETREERPMILTLEASSKWLKYHPEFEAEALSLLVEIKKEVQGETSKEIRGRMKKR